MPSSPSKTGGAGAKKGRDFYEILGVERTANQGQIKQSYRKLAMKHHPDKNPGDEVASEKFKEVSTAYSVLSDPNTKRQYDLHGEEGSVAELGSVNVEDLGTVGRLFGALVSKAGIPVPTEITQKVLTAAQHLAKGATYVPGFDLPKCDTLQWGQSVQSTVDRQCAHFYRLVVTEADMKNGVMVSCKSVGNDKFKVVFFDSEGHVAMVEESQKRKRHSEANLYVVPFARYNYVESMPLSLMKNLQDDVPPVFMILDTFDKDVKSLLPGTHLFCVYGDNWFQSVKYTMRALVAVPKGRDCVISIQSSEAQLALKKMDLENFQAEFCETKKKYEEACKRLEEDITKISELFDERDKSYNAYIDQSAEKYGANRPVRPGTAPQPPPAAQANSSTSTGGGGLLGGIGKLFG